MMYMYNGCSLYVANFREFGALKDKIFVINDHQQNRQKIEHFEIENLHSGIDKYFKYFFVLFDYIVAIHSFYIFYGMRSLLQVDINNVMSKQIDRIAIKMGFVFL